MTLWNVSSGQALALVSQRTQIREAAFSPDGRTLALDQGEGRIFVYELASETERRTYVRKGEEQEPILVSRRGQLGAFNTMTSRNLAFAPDGRRMAFASDNRIIHVWDLLTGEEVGRLAGHQGDVSALTFAPDSKTLASAGEDATGLIWDMTALKSATKPPARFDDKVIEKLWDELQSATAAPAFVAIGSLIESPAQTVRLLDQRLKAPEAVAEARLEKLIADLDARRFATRKKALQELEKLGALAVPALTRTLAGKTSEEQKKRIQELVDRAKGQTLTPLQLQIVRAVEVLERAGTAEAKSVLERLARGPAGALETEQARAALRRWR